MKFNPPLPLPVQRSLLRLGEGLSMARRRRHLSQSDMAERMGTTANTVRRMEAGSPGTSIQHLAKALQILGELDKLDALLESKNDSIGLMMMDEKLPKRIRKSKITPETGGF